MLKINLRNFLVLALSLELLFSSIGIAQVNHLCKMAGIGMETKSCENSGQKTHDCCRVLSTLPDNKLNSEPCCTNTIKYFYYKVSGNNQNSYSYHPIQVASVQLFSKLIPAFQSPADSSNFSKPDELQSETVQHKTISITALLI